MKKEEQDGGEVDISALWRRIAELENGALPPEERELLNKELEESPEAREAYLEYFELVSLLRFEAETQEKEGTLPVIGADWKKRTFPKPCRGSGKRAFS